MMEELKPASKTLEGRIVAGVITACVPILGYLAGTDTQPEDIDKVVAVAGAAVDSITEFQNYWNLVQTIPPEFTKFGKFGSVLFFMYKLATFYIGKRMDLKLAVVNKKGEEVKNV